MQNLSSLTRDWTSHLFSGVQSLNHWTAKEVPPAGPLGMVFPLLGTLFIKASIWLMSRYSFFKTQNKGLPWWSSGKESACQSRRHRFDPWSLTKPVHHNCWACTLEPKNLNYWAHCAATAEAHVPWSLRSVATREATAMRSLLSATKRSPHLLQLEKSPWAIKSSLITTSS